VRLPRSGDGPSKAFSPDRLCLARQQRPLSVAEADSPTTQPIFEQAVLCLKEFDDDQLMAMNSAGDN